MRRMGVEEFYMGLFSSRIFIFYWSKREKKSRGGGGALLTYEVAQESEIVRASNLGGGQVKLLVMAQ